MYICIEVFDDADACITIYMECKHAYRQNGKKELRKYKNIKVINQIQEKLRITNDQY